MQEPFHLILPLSTKDAAGPGLEPGTARSKVWSATIAPAGNDLSLSDSNLNFEPRNQVEAVSHPVGFVLRTNRAEILRFHFLGMAGWRHQALPVDPGINF